MHNMLSTTFFLPASPLTSSSSLNTLDERDQEQLVFLRKDILVFVGFNAIIFGIIVVRVVDATPEAVKKNAKILQFIVKNQPQLSHNGQAATRFNVNSIACLLLEML